MLKIKLMFYKQGLYLAAALCLAVTVAHAQSVDSLTGKLASFPTRFFNKISGKTTDLQQQLNRQTAIYLRRMSRQEEKLKARLYKQDSAKAAPLYPQDPKQQYAAMLQKFHQDSARVFTSMGPEYLPRVDSLQGVLGFLTKNPNLLNANPALQAKMQSALVQFQQLQAKLQAADLIKQYIQNRKAQIQQYLSSYTHLPSGITNAFQGYKQQAYYYADQVREYRAMLNDPDKMMQTALVLLNKLPAFSSFMQKNSFLAGLFGVPVGYGTEQGMVGLQTRDQVMGMIKSQMGQGGASGASAIQQSLQTAHQDISNLQNKLSSLGGGSGGMDMPDFKPNDQKKKTFLKRLEVGVNFQTAQTTNYYPTTSDLGLSLGYKLNQSNLIGIGASYKLGLGDGFQHIAFSSQGLSLRSFIQLKVKKSWGAAGGFEYNYQQPFTSYQDIRNLSAWARSGFIGVTKTVSMKSTVFKKTQVQLLWDFLSYSQVPKTSPVIFRVGYSF
jgi:hypothetical protein